MPKKVQAKRSTPKGHFVVYVGSEMTRFVLPTSYLKNPFFQKLLDKAAEEYGFHDTYKILLPFDEPTFRQFIAILGKS